MAILGIIQEEGIEVLKKIEKIEVLRDNNDVEFISYSILNDYGVETYKHFLDDNSWCRVFCSVDGTGYSTRPCKISRLDLYTHMPFLGEAELGLCESEVGLCESEVDSVNDFKNCLEKMESQEATKDWYESRIKDLEAELAMTRVLLKMTTEKLVSSGIVAG